MSVNTNNIVLLIEDDQEIISIISYILTDVGCNVILATPADYLDIIKEKKPGVILLDYWILHTLGSEICISLKSSPETSSIPVILTSAVNNIDQIAATCLADDVLAKPFDIDDLENMVIKWLNISGADIADERH